jgi:hypothetical protein
VFEIEPPPRSRTEISAALDALERETAVRLEELSDEEFLTPQGAHWSPAGHVRHLAKSVRAVARGMALPAVVLLPFGLARGGSRTFEEVRRAYGETLAAGGQAGRFAPGPTHEERGAIVSGWRSANRQLSGALADWSEKALDRYRLPHPLLGKLTVREMLFFTVHHNAHHARRVLERAKTARC